ncbi:hypothetical protein Tco_1448058 [Tanacetum coccineum]
MFDEYNHQITYRADPLPITKISYRVNSSKEATMRITRANDPLNITVHDRFRLKSLGFSEWLEVHTLASKTKRKSNDMLLQSLKAKFEWVLNQARALGILPLPELSSFGIPVEDRKRKRTSEILQQVFVKENIVVDGMKRNLAPPPGVECRKGLVIKEPEEGIFYYNGNFDLVFQRVSELHLATTSQLIRLQGSIIRDGKIRLSLEEHLSGGLRGNKAQAKCKASVGWEEPLSDGLRGNEVQDECKALAGSERTL